MTSTFFYESKLKEEGERVLWKPVFNRTVADVDELNRNNEVARYIPTTERLDHTWNELRC